MKDLWKEEDLLQACGIVAARVDAFELSRIRSQPGKQTPRAEAAVDEDTVAIYAADYAEGAVLPAIVVHAPENSKWATLLSGYHRKAGAEKAGLITLPALVIQNLSDAQGRKFVAMANRNLGRGASMDDRIYHAQHLHTVHGVPLDEAARISGAPLSRVEGHIKEERVIQRLDRLGVDRPKRATAIRRLDTVPQDRVFAALAGVADRFTVAEFSSLATEATKARSEDSAFKMIVDRAKEKDEAVRRAGNMRRKQVGKSSAYVKIQQAARAAKRLPSEAEVRALPEDIAERAKGELAGIIKAVNKCLEWIR